VQDGAVLYIHPVADPDGVYIASQHSPEPDTATFAYLYIADNSGVVC
jgi:hypothetical protein